jgi:signal transduction histidine kinase
MTSMPPLTEELTRALMFMQLPLIAFLAIASFQAQRSLRRGAFAIIGTGWILNALYVGFSSALMVIRSRHPSDATTLSHVALLASLFDLASAALFALSFLAGDSPYSWPRPWLRMDVIGVFLFAALAWVLAAIGDRYSSTDAIAFIWLSAGLVAFGIVARILLAKSLFARTKVVRLGGGPKHLYIASLAYAAIQPIYLLSPFTKYAEFLGWSLGFVAKAGIALGFVKLFNVLATQLAGERQATVTATRLLGRIRHELNTPLGELGNWLAAAMPEAPTHGKLRQHLIAMESATQRALAITAVPNDVLYRAVVNQGLIPDPDQRTGRAVANANVLAQTAILAVKATRAEPVNWQVNLSSNCCLECESAEIVQVLINLLRNSVDAISAVGDGKIIVTTANIRTVANIADELGRVRFTVLDDGEGFDRKIQETAFTDGFSTRVGLNRGHGLSVVRQLVSANRGSIQVKSPVTKSPQRPGTEIQIEFPRARCK